MILCAHHLPEKGRRPGETNSSPEPKRPVSSSGLYRLPLRFFLILTIFLTPAGLFAEGRDSGVDRRLVERAESITGDTFRHLGRTPRGAVVVGVSKPSAQTLAAVDQGLTALFAIAQRRGYRARLNYTDYTIFIARADRTKNGDGAYSPDIALPAAQYAGSVYDQGGYVYAAGMVLSFTPCSLVIAEHERDLGRFADVVRYEGEHLVLYHNDPPLYRRTADHSRGGGHPILQ